MCQNYQLTEQFILKIGLHVFINKCVSLQAYDATNFLVDLSGRYVTCSRVGHRGVMHIAEVQENRAPICGLIDYGFGGGAHTRAVNMYISETLDTWVNDPEFVDVVSMVTSP